MNDMKLLVAAGIIRAGVHHPVVVVFGRAIPAEAIAPEVLHLFKVTDEQTPDPPLEGPGTTQVTSD